MAEEAGQPSLASLVAAHSDRIAGYLYAIGAEPAQVEEVVQEVALAAAASQDRPDEPLAWLLAVARRRFIDLLRRSRSRSRREQPIGALADAVVEAMAEPDAGLDAGGEAEVAALRRCLARLAPRARGLLDLRYWQGLGTEAIAMAIGWREPAVRVALSKARRAVEACVRRALAGGEAGDVRR